MLFNQNVLGGKATVPDIVAKWDGRRTKFGLIGIDRVIFHSIEPRGLIILLTAGLKRSVDNNQAECKSSELTTEKAQSSSRHY